MEELNLEEKQLLESLSTRSIDLFVTPENADEILNIKSGLAELGVEERRGDELIAAITRVKDRGESFLELTDGTQYFISPQLSKALERKLGFSQS